MATIKISGDGLTFDSEATMLQAAQIIGFLNTNEPLAASNSSGSIYDSPGSVPLVGPERRTSMREELLRANAKTNPQKILTLGQFVAERDGTESFSVGDVKLAFSKAGEPSPRNLSRDLKEAVRLGYIFEDDGRANHYIVSNSGLEMLQTGFTVQAETARRSKSRRNSRQGSSNSARISEAVQKLEVTDILENLPNYHSLAKKTDKVLWAMALAKQRGEIESISAKEVEDIIRRLSDSIPAYQVAPFTKSSLRRNYVSKTSEGYRLLHAGLDYLKTLSGTTDEGEFKS